MGVFVCLLFGGWGNACCDLCICSFRFLKLLVFLFVLEGGICLGVFVCLMFGGGGGMLIVICVFVAFAFFLCFCLFWGWVGVLI